MLYWMLYWMLNEFANFVVSDSTQRLPTGPSGLRSHLESESRYCRHNIHITSNNREIATVLRLNDQISRAPTHPEHDNPRRQSVTLSSRCQRCGLRSPRPRWGGTNMFVRNGGIWCDELPKIIEVHPAARGTTKRL